MVIEDKLREELQGALMERPVSFLVMNHKTMKELLKHPFLIDMGD